MPALTNVACPPFPCRDKNRWAPCVVCAYNGRRAGESSRCEDPAPTVGIGGEIVAGYAAPTIVYAHIGINGSGDWADNDAARRVATYLENRENMF